MYLWILNWNLKGILIYEFEILSDQANSVINPNSDINPLTDA